MTAAYLILKSQGEAHKERWGFHVFRPAVVTRSPTKWKSLCQSPCCQRTFCFCFGNTKTRVQLLVKNIHPSFSYERGGGMYILLFSQTLFSSGITNILGYLLVKKQHPDSFGEKVCDEPWRANELSQRTFLFCF